MFDTRLFQAADFPASKECGVVIGCNCGGNITLKTDHPTAATPVGNWWVHLSKKADPHKDFWLKIEPGIPVTIASDKHLPEGKLQIVHDNPTSPSAGYLSVVSDIFDKV
jgi:hypothetical protein